MDEDRCLNCTCTFETGCREEQQTNETLKLRRPYIPPRRLPIPPVPPRRIDHETARARDRRRVKLEALGFTVRERKRT